MVKNNSILKLSILAIASIMTISMLGTSNIINAHAQVQIKQTVEIINELDTELTYKEIIKGSTEIITDPPHKVKTGDTGSFKIKPITTPSLFYITYYVGQSGASEEVTFGFNHKGCSTKTPDDIKGSYEGCYTPPIKYTFQPK